MKKEEFFERYSIDIAEGRLGGGAFGTVYKAYDRLMDQWKAVKVAEVKFIGNKKFSLIGEFEAAKSLAAHKNIANYESVYQFQMANGIFDYAIMQFYQEGNLKQLLSRRKLGINEKLFIINSLLSGISFLHVNHIIHRDLKPSNILISKDYEGNFIPKIADFGLSKIIDDDAGLLLSNSFQGGTLQYSPPEQLFGKEINYNADLWSFGVISYEILTNKKLFAEDNLSGSIDAKRAILYKNIVSLDIHDKLRECPYPYDELIALCIIRNPKERVRNGEELIEFLKSPSKINLLNDFKEQDEETFIIGVEQDDQSLMDRHVLRDGVDSLKQNVFNLKNRFSQNREKARLRKEKEEEARRQKALAEQKRKEEAERLRKEKEEKARRQKALAEQKRKEEEERLRKEKEEEARRQKALAEQKRKEEEERLRKEKEEEARRQKALAEQKRKEEEARLRKEKEEEARRQKALAEQKRKEEEARLRKEKEEEARRQKALAEQKRKEEEARLRKEKEEEARRQKALAEQKRKEEEERLRKEKEEEARRQKALAEQKRKEEEERLRKEKEEEARRQKALAEQKRKRKERLRKEKADKKKIQKQEKGQSKRPSESQVVTNSGERVESSKQKSINSKDKKKGVVALLLLLISFGSYYTYSKYSATPVILKIGDKFNVKKEGGSIGERILFDEIGVFEWGQAEAIRGDSVFNLYLDGTFEFVKRINTNSKKTSDLGGEEPSDNHEEKQVVEINNKEQIEQQFEKEYQDLKKSEDIKKLEKFLTKWPNNKYQSIIEKRISVLVSRIEAQDEEELYKQVVLSRSKTLVQEYMKRYPDGVNLEKVVEIGEEIQVKEVEDAWKEVAGLRNIGKFEEYILTNPNSPYLEEANKMLSQLKADRAWLKIQSTMDVGELEKYIREFSDSEHVSKAKERIEFLKRKKSIKNLKSKLKSSVEKIDLSHLSASDQVELKKLTNLIDQDNVSETELRDLDLKIKKLSQKAEDNASVVELPELIEDIESTFVERSGSRKYILGCEGKGCQKDETPAIEVVVRPFAISKYEVTQRQWKKIMGNNPSYYADNRSGSYPVENISYNEVQLFLSKLNSVDGNPYVYRLPTEAEWEYAASANSNNTYAGSKDIEQVAHYGVPDGTAKVGSKKANSYGLYDMSGNVAEYTSDWYKRYDEKKSEKKYIVIRGGSWRNKPKSCRVKARDFMLPDDKNIKTGFRLVRALK